MKTHIFEFDINIILNFCFKKLHRKSKRNKVEGSPFFKNKTKRERKKIEIKKCYSPIFSLKSENNATQIIKTNHRQLRVYPKLINPLI